MTAERTIFLTENTMLNATKQSARRQEVQMGGAGLQAILSSHPTTQAFYPFPVSHELRNSDDHRSLLSDRKFLERAVQEVAKIVHDQDIETLSFDVFDTALLRNQFCEAKRFYTVAEMFVKKCRGAFTVTDALVARSIAARAAYTFASPAPDGTREGTMAMIATIVCAELGVPKMKNEYIKTEITFEKASLSPNPLVIHLLKSFPKLKSIFISDMYLESPHIRSLLEPAFGKAVTVLSSADGYGSKRCGGLFEYAESYLTVEPRKTLHFGDSLESDFRQAKRRGFNAFYLPIPDQERSIRMQCYRALGDELNNHSINLDSIFSFNC